MDALKCAAEGQVYICPIPLDQKLPMIHCDDLTDGLIKLMDAPVNVLSEPQQGYAISGFAFTPAQLFAEIRLHIPGFQYEMADDVTTTPIAKFAKLWPDSLSPSEAARDFHFTANINMQ